MTDKTLHPLYQEIDRGLAEDNYVIVNPIDHDGLVYLTPKDFKRSMDTWLNNGIKVTILHSPFSKRDVEALKSYDFKGSASGSKPVTPLKGAKGILSKRSVVLNLLSGTWNESKMISLTNSNGLDLLRFYLRLVIPLSLNRKVKDVSGKMWLTIRFLTHCVKMQRSNGAKYVVSYLKLSQLAISRAIGRQPLGSLMEIDSSLIHRGLSRNGLPRFIPVGDRRRILSGSSRTIRFWLTLYGLYRILQSPAVPKLSTITDPIEASEGILVSLSEFFFSHSNKLFRRFHKWDLSSLLVQKWENLKTASSTSLVSWMGVLSGTLYMMKNYNHIYSALREYCELTQNSSQSILYGFFSFIEQVSVKYEQFKQESNPEYQFDKVFHNENYRKDPSVGRLACKVEPAGKVRVFAMVDILTQNVLKPLHLVLSKILKALPNDGTFDQEGMVDRAFKKALFYKASYCYDLSAATDRLPIIIQVKIIEAMFGKRISELWKTILVDRPYYLPDNEVTRKIFKSDVTSIGKEYFYSTGQPMGALSSFNMLGITHHMIMQYCAYKVFKYQDLLYFHKGWCIAYEILGDDIAIFHKELAMKYLEVMSELGVAINVKKSVIDSKGLTLELAKRTIHHGKDVSAISFKDILSSAPFAQRAAIVERVTRRGTAQTSTAISILSQFYGENPSIRQSYMLLSLFFKGMTDKKVSLIDTYFLLFLMKKFSKVPFGSGMSYSEEFVRILYSVVNKIYFKGLTSYNTEHKTLFSQAIWSEYVVEFNCTLLTMVPIFRTETLNRVKEYTQHATWIVLSKNENGSSNLISLDRLYLAIILGHQGSDEPILRQKSNNFYLHIDMSQPSFSQSPNKGYMSASLGFNPSFTPLNRFGNLSSGHATMNFNSNGSLIQDLSGFYTINELRVLVSHLASPLASPYKGLVPGQNPMDFFDLEGPREHSLKDLNTINVSSLSDLIFLNKEIDRFEQQKIELVPKPVSEVKFHPLNDLSEDYDYLSVIHDFLIGSLHEGENLIPTVEMTYSQITLAYYEIWALSVLLEVIYPEDHWNALVTRFYYSDASSNEEGLQNNPDN